MFDIGFGELLLIAVVALIVLGPERLPKAARFAGLWVRRARAQWYSVKSELEREMAADELKRSLQETRAAAQDIGRQVEDAAREVDARVREAEEDTRREVESMRRQVEGSSGVGDAVAPPAQVIEADAGAGAEAEAASAEAAPEQPDLLAPRGEDDDGRQR